MSTVVSMQDWLNQHSENNEADKRLFLTEEEVRSFPLFKDATPEEVANIIATLHDLAKDKIFSDRISVSGLPKGLYFLQIYSKSKIIGKTKKVLKL
jgi:hypothetical protein